MHILYRPTKMNICCSVGDILKFGQSSRLFIIGGPAELMPEEGLSRAQRHHLRALEVVPLPLKKFAANVKSQTKNETSVCKSNRCLNPVTKRSACSMLRSMGS